MTSPTDISSNAGSGAKHIDRNVRKITEPIPVADVKSIRSIRPPQQRGTVHLNTGNAFDLIIRDCPISPEEWSVERYRPRDTRMPRRNRRGEEARAGAGRQCAKTPRNRAGAKPSATKDNR